MTVALTRARAYNAGAYLDLYKRGIVAHFASSRHPVRVHGASGHELRARRIWVSHRAPGGVRCTPSEISSKIAVRHGATSRPPKPVAMTALSSLVVFPGVDCFFLMETALRWHSLGYKPRSFRSNPNRARSRYKGLPDLTTSTVLAHARTRWGGR